MKITWPQKGLGLLFFGHPLPLAPLLPLYMHGGLNSQVGKEIVLVLIFLPSVICYLFLVFSNTVKQHLGFLFVTYLLSTSVLGTVCLVAAESFAFQAMIVFSFFAVTFSVLLRIRCVNGSQCANRSRSIHSLTRFCRLLLLAPNH